MTLTFTVSPGKDGLSYDTVTIASGESLSGAIDLQGLVPAGVLIPAAWNAASITFQASIDGVTYGSVYNVNGELSYPAAAGLWMTLDPASFAGMRYLKVRSGTAGSPVAQGADRSLVVSCRNIE